MLSADPTAKGSKNSKGKKVVHGCFAIVQAMTFLKEFLSPLKFFPADNKSKEVLKSLHMQ